MGNDNDKKASDLQKIFDAVPQYARIDVAWEKRDNKAPDDEMGCKPLLEAGFVLAFGIPGIGFGDFTFVQGPDGQLYLDTECTSRETIMECLKHWVDSAITDHTKDPEKHKKYNEVRGARCGEHCKMCYPDKTG